jgi:hypothetical protein
MKHNAKFYSTPIIFHKQGVNVKISKKNLLRARGQWLTPVILATRTGGSRVEDSLGK